MPIDRTSLQVKTADLILKEKRVVAQWATGTGKTLPAIYATKKIVEENPNAKIMIIVAERAHKTNWRGEFLKFLTEEQTNTLFNNIVMECYNSLHKYRDTECDLIIFDEAHHLFSDLRVAIARTIKPKYVVALSATLKSEMIYELEYMYGKFYVSRISTQKSIDNGFVGQPQIKVIPLELGEKIPSEDIIIEVGAKAKRKTIYCSFKDRLKYLQNRKDYPNVKLVVSATQKEKYNYIEEQFNLAKRQYMLRPGTTYLKNAWLQWGMKRKRYLGELKTVYVQRLVHNLNKNNKRFLCFCTSIAQANELSNNNAVHSKNKDSFKIIEKFNNEQLSSLFAVGMLTEGVTLTGLDTGILVQLDNETRLFHQKLGRMLRSEDPVIYIFYYKDTRDEEFLNNALSEISSEYITIL